MLEALDATLEQLNQLNELVDSLLTLARADEGRSPLALEVQDLRTLVVDVGETAGMLAEQHGLTSQIRVPDHAVEVRVDSHRMHQLLLNLVTNAVKYTPAGGSVGIALEEGRRGSGCRSGTPASGSPRSTFPTYSTASGAPTRRAPGLATAPGWGWDWPSRNGLPRRTAGPSRSRAGRGAGPISWLPCPRRGVAERSVEG